MIHLEPARTKLGGQEHDGWLLHLPLGAASFFIPRNDRAGDWIIVGSAVPVLGVQDFTVASICRRRDLKELVERLQQALAVIG